MSLTIDNPTAMGWSITLVEPVGGGYYLQRTKVQGWSASQTGNRSFRDYWTNSTTVSGPFYWVPMAKMNSACGSPCPDHTYGGWFNYMGNDNPG